MLLLFGPCLVSGEKNFTKKNLACIEYLNKIYLQNFLKIDIILRAESNVLNESMIRYNNAIVNIL